jgi:hypothetical protein
MAGKRKLTQADYQSDDRPLGYSQCEWLSDGERCRYPGSISRHTNGHGPWYCSAHDLCLTGMDGAQIVEASRNYRHRPIVERDARYVKEVLKNPNHKPKLRGCEARECINPSTAREDGHYLCYLHRTVSADKLGQQITQPLPPRAQEFLPPMREPGSDDEEVTA